MKIKCPGCQKQIEYSKENAFRPFCSERCKLIDLGQWAEGKYSIPVVDHSDIEDEISDEMVDESGESIIPPGGGDDLH